jgi:multidrug resistance efflux pump
VHPTSSPRVSTFLAARGSLSSSRQLGGFIAPGQNVLITSALSEPAASVNVTEGEHVSRGDVLATFDVSDLRATYEADLHAALQADANAAKQQFAGAQTISAGSSAAANATSTLAQAKQKLALDDLNLTRDAQLVKQQYIAQQAYDAQAQVVASDQASVSAATAALNSAQLTVQTNGSQSNGLQGATLESLREAAAQAHAVAGGVAAQIQRATVTAPVDGVITNRNINPGEYPGSRTLFTLQSVSLVYASLNASSSQLSGVSVGNAVAVRTQSGRTSHSGRVVAVLGQAAPGSTNFTIKVGVENRLVTLLAGMAVTGTVTLKPQTGIKIPRSAFAGGTENSVGVVRDGRYQTAAVTVLAEDGSDAIVDGLAPGTRIISNGVTFAAGQTLAAN